MGAAMVRSNTHLLVELSTRRGQRPMLGPIRHVVSSSAPMQAYALAAALADSGKLQAMDALLAKLKTEGHRVLIFTQARLQGCDATEVSADVHPPTRDPPRSTQGSPMWHGTDAVGGTSATYGPDSICLQSCVGRVPV